MSGCCVDMLTDIDKPLDKLEDLTASEMCVPFIDSLRAVLNQCVACSENMQGAASLLVRSTSSRGSLSPSRLV